MTGLSDILCRYGLSLGRVFALQAQIRDIHPLFEAPFPIAVFENDTFLVFEPDNTSAAYHLAARESTSMPIPRGVQAAFPFDCLGGKTACVITDDAFDTKHGYAMIFHEFVHCYQWETCEQTLRAQLSLAQKAQADGDPMWEIAHPFPYEYAAATYREWSYELDQGDYAAAQRARQGLRAALSDFDWDYVTWQEWKEGFARHIENRLRPRLGLEPNAGGSSGDLSRVAFYAGGATYIGHLVRRTPALETDLVALFGAIRDPRSRQLTRAQ